MRANESDPPLRGDKLCAACSQKRRARAPLSSANNGSPDAPKDTYAPPLFLPSSLHKPIPFSSPFFFFPILISRVVEDLHNSNYTRSRNLSSQ